MKKFSKITESKQFLGWSKEKLENEFKQLSPAELVIDILYVYKSGNDSECVGGMEEIEEYSLQDKIFAPMFFISISLGNVPTKSYSHEINGNQTDNWSDETIKFDLIKDEFIKVSDFLDKYREDFYISIEIGSNKATWPHRGSNSFPSKGYLINFALSLTMKDYFEYDQIK